MAMATAVAALRPTVGTACCDGAGSCNGRAFLERGELSFKMMRISRPGTRSSRLRSSSPALAAPDDKSDVSESAEVTAAANREEGPENTFEGVKVLDLTGKAITLTDLWRERKALVAFARHFGCVLCRKRADILASKKEIMDAAGVALILIGPGSVEQARSFSEQTKFGGEIYADPNHAAYNTLGFAYGALKTFTPLAGAKIVQLYMEGYRQDWGLSFQKETVARGGWQQGGILVAGPGVSNILYLHKDKEAGDDPDIQDVLNACCS